VTAKLFAHLSHARRSAILVPLFEISRILGLFCFFFFRFGFPMAAEGVSQAMPDGFNLGGELSSDFACSMEMRLALA
jgi:hypothetical protein